MRWLKAPASVRGVCWVAEVEENNWSTPRTDSPFVFDGFVWLEVVLLDAVLWVLLIGIRAEDHRTLGRSQAVIAALIAASVKVTVTLPAASSRPAHHPGSPSR